MLWRIRHDFGRWTLLNTPLVIHRLDVSLVAKQCRLA